MKYFHVTLTSFISALVMKIVLFCDYHINFLLHVIHFWMVGTGTELVLDNDNCLKIFLPKEPRDNRLGEVPEG